jgi:small subunit ribosomal protein S2
MKPYIFGDRNGIYIIDLKRTLIELDKTYTFVSDLAARGGTLLFVGTKKQAQEAVSTNAERCGMPYVNARWLGGMLTNFVTIRSRVTYMEDLEAMEADGRMATLPKKEQILLRKELAKLQANLNGVRNMKSVPQAVFVIDTKREEIAIHEAHRLGIPVIGVIDTNADPDEVDYGIPANDDAIRSIALLCEVVADAVIAGATGAVIAEAEMIDAPPPPPADTVAPDKAPVDTAAAADKPAAADKAPAIDEAPADKPAPSAEPPAASVEPDTDVKPEVAEVKEAATDTPSESETVKQPRDVKPDEEAAADKPAAKKPAGKTAAKKPASKTTAKKAPAKSSEEKQEKPEGKAEKASKKTSKKAAEPTEKSTAAAADEATDKTAAEKDATSEK